MLIIEKLFSKKLLFKFQDRKGRLIERNEDENTTKLSEISSYKPGTTD